MSTLAPFDDHDVVQATIKVTRAGDGLSQALSIAPVEFHLGETVHVVLRCEVAQITHVPIKDTDVLARVHTLRAGLATIVDATLVGKVLDAQAIAIEQAAGVARLEFDEDDDE